MKQYQRCCFPLVFISFLLSGEQECSRLLEQLHEPMVYAPWRDTYKSKKKKTHNVEDQCVFCSLPGDAGHNFILARYEHCFVVLNIYPYTKGHVLVIPYQHGPSLSALSSAARTEIMDVVALSIDIIQETLKCPGFNIGINMGAAAKASIPDHLHIHVMPRYEIDAGFATMVGGVRVVAWDLLELYQTLIGKYEHLEYEELSA